MPPVYKVLIIGGGVIGLSLARQLRHRRISVTVSDPAFSLQAGRSAPGASHAAAGMLAVHDPGNPPQLLPLSRLSRSLYNDFLAEITDVSGQPVPFQTHITRQTLPDGSVGELSEESLDPRQLAPALRLAVERLGATLTPETLSLQNNAFNAAPFKDDPFDAVVYTAGAWTSAGGTPVNPGFTLPVTPRKGQMLRVLTPPGLELHEVHRAEHVYVVPRLFGPQAGTALIGATVEDAGFDPTVAPHALETLRSRASELVPALADEHRTPAIEAWVGFRPSTPDSLPVIGELAPLPSANPAVAVPRRLVATGHYRNGILLAPATAVLVADLLEGIVPPTSPEISLQTSLAAFHPARFTKQ